MSALYLVGVVGARGHTGRELLRLIARHPDLALAYAVSREFAGKPVRELAPEITDDIKFEELAPAEAAERKADVVVLALPDGVGGPYVDAIEAQAPHRVIVDLSADKRFDDTWVYGLPERNRKNIADAKRIANPGCYATAMQLAVAPLLDLVNAPISVFGVSGYSGAGTKPSPRNDPAVLADNLVPYKMTDHNHEREATRHLGKAVRFTPSVHPAFRGLVTTVHAPIDQSLSDANLKERFDKAYGDEPLVQVQDEAPALRDGAGLEGVLIGGVTAGADGASAIVVAAEDNLLKGAAVQAIQNINLALGLKETAGLSVTAPQR
ncbi:MAG: N-acetyl-gamma-glutamyl-phosphate reductase [Pseudomonadota bacterium]